jgi:polysaccharide export outer membrane protein
VMGAASSRRLLAALLIVNAVALPLQAQQKPPADKPATPPAPTGVEVPPDYIIGAEDVLTIVFWREKDLSGDAPVRPDGRISLPLLNDVEAAGLTPDQLRVRLTELADKFISDPTVTVMVKQINSRRVYITGEVAKPGPYPLGGPTTVLQLITTAGGVREYADEKNISIIRTENGKQSRLRFNYDEVKNGKNLQQNVLLRPGDQIIVP